jgi:Cft2 family RNA processing exonuclease
MPLQVKWANGILVEYNVIQVSFDTQSNNLGNVRVFITHAHYDHAKGFDLKEQEKYSTNETWSLAKSYRTTEISNWKTIKPQQRVRIDDLEIRAHNAGHVLGSVQYEVISPEGSLVYTGDINPLNGFTTEAAEIVPCDLLIMETTFGSPCIFPSRKEIAFEICQWTEKSLGIGKIPAFQTDPLGNAQELICIFNQFTKTPVLTHPKVTSISMIYESFGHKLDFIDAKSEEAKKLFSSKNCVYIAPKQPSLTQDDSFNIAYVSGWATRFSGEKTPFPLSDHADFYRLLEFVKEVQPKKVLTCHGSRGASEIFARNVTKMLGIEAKPLSTKEEFLSALNRKFGDWRITNCKERILEILRIPGFAYSRNWILRQLSSNRWEFGEREAEEALDSFARDGILKYDKAIDSYELNRFRE